MSRAAGPLRRGLPPAAAGLPVPADRRFRRSDVRPGRRGTWRSWLRRSLWFTGAGVVVIMLGLWAGSAMLDASVLRIDNLVVRGNGRIPIAEVEARLRGIRGESILRVDLEEYRARLLQSPWVASAELWRVLPSTVQVRVVERTPLAIARVGSELRLVDAEGVLIDTYGPQYAEFDLPIVDGLEASAPGGTTVEPTRIQLVQRLFQDLAVRPDLFARLSQVNVADPRNAIVLVDGEPAELRLGDRDFLSRLQRYEDAVATVRGERTVREYFDLRFGDWIWVK